MVGLSLIGRDIVDALVDMKISKKVNVTENDLNSMSTFTALKDAVTRNVTITFSNKSEIARQLDGMFQTPEFADVATRKVLTNHNVTSFEDFVQTYNVDTKTI